MPKKLRKVSNQKLRVQRQVLEKIKKENQSLKEQIQAQIQATTLTQSVSLNEKINRMNDFADQLVGKVQVETRKLADYENQVEVLEAQIMDARIDMGGVNTAQRNAKLIQKQIDVLESRLEKILKKYSVAIAKNKSLRQNIENLRDERVVFDGIYKKMEKELHTKKRSMADIIEKSNDAYEARDEAIEELKKLQKFSNSIQADYNDQFNELDSIIKTDEDLNTRLKEREKKRSEGLLGSLTRGDQQRLEKKVIKQNWSLAEQRAKYNVSMAKVKQYHDMFEKIREATGLSIDELIKNFQEAENTNFSLFTYVNELNSQIEKLDADINDTAQEIKEHSKDDASQEVQRKKKLIQVQGQVKTQNSMSLDFDSKYNHTLNILKSLTAVIQKMFQGIGCNEGKISQMLGTSKVSENNMMIYLGIIEQRTNFLIQQLAKTENAPDGSESPDGDKEATTKLSSTIVNVVGLGPQHPFSGAEEISIDPPSTGEEGLSDEDSDEMSESERPLTRTELLQKSMRAKQKINRKR